MLNRFARLVAVVSVAIAACGTAQAETKGYRIISVGDIMMGSNYPTPVMDPKLTKGADIGAIIGAPLLRVLRSGDIIFGNMEGALFDGGNQPDMKVCRNPTTCYVFKSPEWHADILKDIGFHLMSVANNHSGDFGNAGRVATIKALQARGIGVGGSEVPSGRTATLILKDGTKVGFVGFSAVPNTLPLNNHDRAAKIVANLKKTHDIVIVTHHGGGEGANATRVPRQTEMFLGENRGDVYAFSRRMIDAGASTVIGQGPHVPRAVDMYKGRFIAYSLGNFWTYGRFNLHGNQGMAPVLDLVVAKSGAVLSAKIHSAKQNYPGTPTLDPTHAAARLMAQLTMQDAPEAKLVISPDGTITGPGIGAKK
ncbi:MAG: CapA family protein [Alphaproteobacteria bacterium]